MFKKTRQKEGLVLLLKGSRIAYSCGMCGDFALGFRGYIALEESNN